MICPDISAGDFTQLCSAVAPPPDPDPLSTARLLPCSLCAVLLCLHSEAICSPAQAIVLAPAPVGGGSSDCDSSCAGNGEECMLSALLSCLCNRAVVKGHMSSPAARFISAIVCPAPPLAPSLPSPTSCFIHPQFTNCRSGLLPAKWPTVPYFEYKFLA